VELHVATQIGRRDHAVVDVGLDAAGGGAGVLGGEQVVDGRRGGGVAVGEGGGEQGHVTGLRVSGVVEVEVVVPPGVFALPHADQLDRVGLRGELSGPVVGREGRPPVGVGDRRLLVVGVVGGAGR